jgi:DNA-binding transcriptional regulator YhcF (GntR family)
MSGASIMDKLQRNLTDYLRESLGVSIEFSPWEEAKSLPLYLSGLYEFLCAEVMECPCLFLLARDGESVTPAALARHLFQIQNVWPDEVVYVCPTMPAHNRQRMVQRHIQFVVPHKHLYIPFLGVESRERTRQKRLSPPRQTFSPATQKVLLHLLLSQDAIPSASRIAAQIGYTAMTISRAFSELESAGLVSVEKQGRSNLVQLSGPKRKIWKKAQSFLFNPVSRIYSVELDGRNGRNVKPQPLASLSALAHYSMLAEPKGLTIAVSRSRAKGLLSNGPLPAGRVDDPGWIAFEVWKYDPGLLDDVVDPLSLALSLQGETDERVQMAVEQMIRDLPW